MLASAPTPQLMRDGVGLLNVHPGTIMHMSAGFDTTMNGRKVLMSVLARHEDPHIHGLVTDGSHLEVITSSWAVGDIETEGHQSP